MLLAIGTAILFWSTVPLFAQTQAYTATLSGSVADPSGARLPGVTVTLKSTERGITRTFTTDAAGLFTFTLLPPSVYAMQVEAKGFSKYSQIGITLGAGQNVEQPVTLTIGTATTEVSVTSEAPLINLENANVSADISQQQVLELPLNLRNVFSLALLNSSVNNSSEYQLVGGNGLSGTADQDVSFLNFGGTFFGTNAFLLDGTWNTGADWGGAVYVPSVDNVQEFKIQTNAFTSQYGWSSGNVVNVVTRSGTSKFHGDAYEFYRNSALDAQYYFAPNKPDFHRHQYGVSVGGPIQIPGVYRGKDKSYFFFNFEGQRSTTPAAPTAVVPTAAMKAGNFAAQLGGAVGADALGRTVYKGAIYNPFTTRRVTAGQVDSTTGLVATASGWIREPYAGNVITSGFDPVAAKMLQYWPDPNSTNPNFNFAQSASSPFHSDEFSARIDHNFTDNTRLNGRFSKKNETKTNSSEYYGANNPGGPGVIDPNNRWSFNLALNHIFTPTFAMSANFGVNRWIEQSQVQGFGFKQSSLGLPSFLDTISPLFPLVIPDGVAGLGPDGGNPNLDEYMVPRNDITYSLDFTKVKGKHSIAFGFMDVVNQLNGGHYFTTRFNFPANMTGGPDPTAVGSTGAGMASFLLGVGKGQTGVNAWPATSKQYLGWYLQDDWKITPRLTLNLGMRYELQTAPTDRHNHQVYFDPTAINPISAGLGYNVLGADVYNTSKDRGQYNMPLTNFGPRIGLAYRLNDKLVARLGYGLFFVPSFRKR